MTLVAPQPFQISKTKGWFPGGVYGLLTGTIPHTVLESSGKDPKEGPQ